MKLTEFFHLKQEEKTVPPEEPMSSTEALSTAFGILTRHDTVVADAIAECLTDTEAYCLTHNDILERRGLCYAEEAVPWLRVIAAVESAVKQGYLRELKGDCEPDSFAAEVRKSLVAAGIDYPVDGIRFDNAKSLAAWARQFNEYAGQSGITLCFVDLYGDDRVMGAARIADYAEAAEIAGYAGVKITSRPE